MKRWEEEAGFPQFKAIKDDKDFLKKLFPEAALSTK
jgi:hypothetical protein